MGAIRQRGNKEQTHHPFLARRRPMAGSGSLYDVMRCGRGSASAARIAIERVERAGAEQSARRVVRMGGEEP